MGTHGLAGAQKLLRSGRGKKTAWTRKTRSARRSKHPALTARPGEKDSRLAEGDFAGVAGAVSAEVVVAEDAGGVAIVEIDLDGVVADLRGGIGAGLGLVHGENEGAGEAGGSHGFLFGAFVVAGGAGAIVTKVGEIVVAGVAVGPGDVYAGAGFHVNFDGDGLFALVEWCGHGE